MGRWTRVAALGLLAVTGAAHAEYGCQDGYVPVFQGGQRACVVDYNLPYWNASGQAAPQRYWSRRWGAIALGTGADGEGLTGHAANYDDEPDAAEAAITDCRSRGGSGCALAYSFKNTCAVAVTANGLLHYFDSEPRVKRAIKKATRACRADGGKDCRVALTVCALAVEVGPDGMPL